VLLISCPWCGARDETEFAYGGQADIVHPPEPEDVADDAWAEFLYHRVTPEGPLTERWCHRAGCRRWFTAVRDTRTNRFESLPETADPTPVHAASD